MSDYVYLKNLNGQQIKPVTDLAAINMTTTNGIGVSTVNGGTIGIIDGYIESAYYTEMADPAVGAANVSSAYVDGGTAVAILGAYTVASAVDTAAPSQQKVPSEKAVVDALNNVVVSGVSYYAGTGIDINAGHTVSVANVPQSSVAGLETTLTGINTAVAAKQDAISAGYRMSLDGTTLNQKRYFDIESPTSATITLQAGHAYKITATNSSKTLDSEQIPANQFGLEGHAEIFVAGTGLIKTTSNVVLAQALEPDAVNNCTVRFHDGKAIISVEDHVAGYIVVSASGTTAGTLPYALSTASNEYISFDASLNNMTLDFGGAVTNSEKHVVGNGYTETIVSGGINCTSKTTFANLGMNGVIVSSGTLTLGDVFIPNGATVAVSGAVRVEKVVNNGTIVCSGGILQVPANGNLLGSGTIDLNGSYLAPGNNTLIVASAIVSGGPNPFGGGCIYAASGKLTISSALISGCSAAYGDVAAVFGTAQLTFKDCVISGNHGSFPIYINGQYGTLTSKTTLTLDNTQLLGAQGVLCYSDNGVIRLVGSNRIEQGVLLKGNGSIGCEITSGAIVDLTGNTNATPINPGGAIVFEAGGATVLVGNSTASSSYMMDGVTVPKIGNTNVIDIGETSVEVSYHGTASITGATVYGTVTSKGLFDLKESASIYLSSCTLTLAASRDYGILSLPTYGGYAELTDCLITGNTNSYGTITIGTVGTGKVVRLKGCTFSNVYTLPNGNFDLAFVSDDGTCELVGYNKFGKGIGKLGGGSGGTVVISSGATVDVASGINPGGCVMIPAGAVVQIGNDGDNNDYKAFGGITGSSIDSHGWIGGATISLPAGASCTYISMPDGQSVTAVGPADIVVPGQLSYCGD